MKGIELGLSWGAACFIRAGTEEHNVGLSGGFKITHVLEVLLGFPFEGAIYQSGNLLGVERSSRFGSRSRIHLHSLTAQETQ